MKLPKLTLAASFHILWLARAGVIQLDVPTGDDVLVLKVGTEHNGPKVEDSCMGRGHSLEIPVKAENIASDTYDVKLPYETHRGFLSDDSSYIKFANIPFAEPPLNKLRFKAPVPPQSKKTEINEGKENRVCSQYPPGWAPKAASFLECYAGAIKSPPTCSFKSNWTEEIDPGDYEGFDGRLFSDEADEDCLVLDVYVPKSVWDRRNENNGKRVPIVAWIHGGGYILGSKHQAGGPQPLLKAAKDKGQDIIYVAPNYRLGAFGWLNGMDFIRAGGTPNAGLHDQRLALSWIQDYIGLFGGDKSSVTVMGQSAGGSSILHHMTAGAGAANLKPNFTRAIVQSPAFLPEPDIYAGNNVYNELKTRVEGNQRASLEDLQKRDQYKLRVVNALMTYYSQYGLFKFGPTVDGDYVPQLPGPLILNNTYHKGIPMILGHTALDGLLFVPPWLRSNQDVQTYLLRLYPDMPDEVLNTISKDTYYGISDKALDLNKINAVVDLLDDIAVSCNNHYLTNAVLKNDTNTPVWRYLFSAKPAIHGADVFFTYYPTEDSPAFVVPKIAKFMQSKYVNFILKGDPNGGDELEWPQYEEKVGKPYRSVMKFGDLVLGNFSINITDPMKHYRCNLWETAPFQPGEDDWMRLKKQVSDHELKI